MSYRRLHDMKRAGNREERLVPRKSYVRLVFGAIGGVGAVAFSSIAGARVVLTPRSTPAAYLHFDVCNGFANQRIAIFSAGVLAKLSNRTLVVPHLGLDGEQSTSLAKRLPVGPSQSTFSLFYDPVAMKSTFGTHGVEVVEYSDQRVRDFHVRHVGPAALARSPSTFARIRHVHVGCPVLSLSAQVVLLHKDFFWDIVTQGLAPSSSVLSIMNSRRKQLFGNRPYNVLHLRIENDWINFCKRWSAINTDNVTRNNCIELDPRVITKRLLALAIERGNPLYVSAHWPSVDPTRRLHTLHALKAAGYDAVSAECEFRQREVCAAVDYFLGRAAYQFVGNSVSTFSGLIILERVHQSSFATYYNGGGLPMAQWLPFYPLPWIVLVGPDTGSIDSISMAKTKSAIRSALQQGGNLRPFIFVCQELMHDANQINDFRRWAARSNVPALIRPCREPEYHTFKSAAPVVDQVVSCSSRIAWMAFEPEWKSLLQYPFALITSNRASMDSRLDLFEFGSKLPQDVALSASCSARHGAGQEHALLANLLALRQLTVRPIGCPDLARLFRDQRSLMNAQRTEKSVSIAMKCR